jgi:hypothetical protein
MTNAVEGGVIFHINLPQAGHAISAPRTAQSNECP